MRVMVLGKATEATENGVMPTVEEFTAMEAYNDELAKAGVVLAGDGLKPSSAGKRVAFDDKGGSSVLDGPFAETKELVAGYQIWEVSSLEEALEWVRRAPIRGGIVEIRPFYGPEDFADVAESGS
ncbi:YciI family protein [Nocardia bovistercoris]|uniref:YciI family protein n=1 Tax=Nocardia bovistercoris TaxID=2785916 RepID=A0A931IJF9_9NOCA|nr:YciI family protein [Nocardia bovistercoris]MBH0780708.1 YciI family protein [Nocardia bovistercoris]